MLNAHTLDHAELASDLLVLNYGLLLLLKIPDENICKVQGHLVELNIIWEFKIKWIK